MNEDLKFLLKCQEKFRGVGSRGRVGFRGGGFRMDKCVGGVESGQGGCGRRSEVFVKIKKKRFSGSGGWVGVGGQGGCERRIEVFVKIQKKKNGEGGGISDWGGVGGWGGQGGRNEELKLLWKCKKKYWG